MKSSDTIINKAPQPLLHNLQWNIIKAIPCLQKGFSVVTSARLELHPITGTSTKLCSHPCLKCAGHEKDQTLAEGRSGLKGCQTSMPKSNKQVSKQASHSTEGLQGPLVACQGSNLQCNWQASKPTSKLRDCKVHCCTQGNWQAKQAKQASQASKPRGTSESTVAPKATGKQAKQASQASKRTCQHKITHVMLARPLREWHNEKLRHNH